MLALGEAAGTGAERHNPDVGIEPPFVGGNAMPECLPPLAILGAALGGMAATLAQVSAILLSLVVVVIVVVYCCYV